MDFFRLWIPKRKSIVLFDRSLPSGEQFVRTSYTKANLNFGVQYLRSSRNNNNTVFGGFALYSLNRPNESLYKVYKGLPMRVTTNLGLRLKLNDDILLQPSLLYMYQSKAKELLTSLLVTSRMENTDVVLLYGLSYRAKDAIIFQLGFTKKSLTCRLSYDLITNYSKLYRNNSFELGFTYFILDSKTSSIENVKAPM